MSCAGLCPRDVLGYQPRCSRSWIANLVPPCGVRVSDSVFQRVGKTQTLGFGALLYVMRVNDERVNTAQRCMEGKNVNPGAAQTLEINVQRVKGAQGPHAGRPAAAVSYLFFLRFYLRIPSVEGTGGLGL